MQYKMFKRSTATDAMGALTKLDNVARKRINEYDSKPSMFQQVLMAKAITDWGTINEASGS